MKKHILLTFFLLLSTSLFAQEPESVLETQTSDLYIGIDAFSSDQSYRFNYTNLNTTFKADTKSKGLRLKFGTISEDNWRVQGFLSSQHIEANLFSVDEGNLYEFGVDIIKQFDLTQDFSFLASAGASEGIMSVNGYSESSIGNVSVRIGVGVLYSITKSLELTAGIDMQYRLWQDIEAINNTIETYDTSTIPYFGLNIHF